LFERRCGRTEVVVAECESVGGSPELEITPVVEGVLCGCEIRRAPVVVEEVKSAVICNRALG